MFYLLNFCFSKEDEIPGKKKKTKLFATHNGKGAHIADRQRLAPTPGEGIQ